MQRKAPVFCSEVAGLIICSAATSPRGWTADGLCQLLPGGRMSPARTEGLGEGGGVE